VDDIRPGDTVVSVYYTGQILVVKVGLKWRGCDAVQCEKQGGKLALYLLHNLMNVNGMTDLFKETLC